MNAELLSLPWQVQVALAAGFAGYLTAYAGLRQRHNAVDVAFYALVFGLFATAAFGFARSRLGEIPSGLSGFAFAVLVGAIWRKWGRSFWWTLLRKTHVTHSDDEPTALSALSSSTHSDVTQAAVLVDDGTWLCCDETSVVADAVHSPVIIGPKGDVLLIVTSIEEAGKNIRRLKTVRDPYYGDRVTYIPAERIRRITLRYRRR